MVNSGVAGESSLLFQFITIAFMAFGVIVFPYLAIIVLISLAMYRERLLFALGLATLAELILQVANSAANDNEQIYYSLVFPYFIGIAAVSAYKLFISKMPHKEAS